MSALKPNPINVTFSTKKLTLYGDEQTDNAYHIWLHLIGDEWAIQSLKFNWNKMSSAAVIGNMVLESSVNPGVWEGYIEEPSDIQSFSGGFGLVQWTPAKKYINWAQGYGYHWSYPDREGLDAQLRRLMYEYNHPEIQWSTNLGLQLTFTEFALNTRNLSLEQLVYVFGSQYEKPKDLSSTINLRVEYAKHYYSLFTGLSPFKKSNWIYYLQSPAIKYL